MSEFSCKGGSGHFIITRFNVNVNFLPGQANVAACEYKGLSTDYLDRRFELFETYTVPSIKNQTNQNFLWIVMFHAQTPQKYKDYIAALQKEYPVFCPLFVEHFANHEEVLNNYLMSFGAARYILSRVDNDDALHCNYVAHAQTMAHESKEEEYIIIYNYGIQYHEKHKIVTKYLFEKNHFSTMVTTYDGETPLKNTLRYNHMNVGEHFLLKELTLAYPMWIEVVHESNVSNRMRCKVKDIIKDTSVLDDFGVDFQIPPSAYRTARLYLVFRRLFNMGRLLKSYGIKGCLAKVKGKIMK